MNRIAIAVACFAAILGIAEPGVSQQDPLAEHKIRGLKGLKTLAITLRPGGSLIEDNARFGEWSDRLDVMLSRTVPSLGRSVMKDYDAWLVLSLVTSDGGAAVELSLYRLTRIVESGEVVFSQVWTDSRYLFGAAREEALKNALDTVLTSFAAAYLRANR